MKLIDLKTLTLYVKNNLHIVLFYNDNYDFAQLYIVNYLKKQVLDNRLIINIKDITDIMNNMLNIFNKYGKKNYSINKMYDLFFYKEKKY